MKATHHPIQNPSDDKPTPTEIADRLAIAQDMLDALADPPAPGDLPAMWRDFKETEAAIDAEPRDGDPLPQDHPLWQRYHAARLAIVNARPHDLTGLSIQLRRYAELVEHSDPNDADRAMLAHVVEQLSELAQGEPS